MATRSSITPTDEILFQEIIVGVEGEAGGRDAACLARVIGPGARRTLVYVQLFNPAGDHPTMLDIDRVDDGDSLGDALAEERRLCANAPACVRVLDDSVADGLDHEAARRTADLIVVGACHRHGLARLLWGDDTRAVLHLSPVSVAVAPAGYARAPRTPTRVGVIDDSSGASAVALSHAGLLANRFDAELQVCGIAFLDAGTIRTRLRKFVTEVDMLVCTSHREGALARLVMGSQSDWLLRHVRIPVLILPG